MKKFESFLAAEFTAFIQYRKSLGYDIKSTKSYLHTFDNYLMKSGSKPQKLSSAFFLKMRADLKLEPVSVNTAMLNIGYFFRYMIRKGLYETNPVEDLPALAKYAFVPFIFSPEQIDQLLDVMVARIRNREKCFLKDFSEYLAIAMMARCGMRISEPLRLLEKHYRADENTLYIEKTKFKKDRLIPIPKTLARLIENYLAARNALIDTKQNPFLLVANAKKALREDRVRPVFYRAVAEIGLARPRRVVASTILARPTPHSLRHSFAVNTLQSVKNRGLSPQNALPILAVYMGHKKYKHTIRYLKLMDAEHRNSINDFFTTHQER